jgi:hypothetical protein
MNDRYKYTCAFCDKSVGARFDYCSTCNRNFTDMYGKGWVTLEWAAYMIQNQRDMAKVQEQDYKVIDKGNQYARSSVISLDYANASADIDGRNVNNTHYTLPDARKDTTYDTTIRDLVRMGMGARKIHSALVFKYGADAVSFSTVQRRVKFYKAS